MPLIINLVAMAACLFGSAGRVDWLNGWVLIGLSLLTGVAATAVVWRDPQLVAERRNLQAGEAWDKAIVGFVVLLGPAATWITAGLDVHHHWSSGLPAAAVAGGVLGAVLGGVLLAWAMGSNRFFSSVVRLQRDRGQTVVTGGPYRFVRHPGYAGSALFMLATPLILGSPWAFLPAAITVAVMVLRTALEDRMLQRGLDGYAAYAQSVKSRLIPFVW